MTFGVISLVPVLFVCTVAILTKRVLEPLLFGSVLGFVIVAKTGFAYAWLDALYTVLADDSLHFIIIVTLLFAIFTVLLQSSGSAKQFTIFARQYIKSQRGSMVVTWILGMIVFIDDYLNTLIVGPAVRELTDEQGVPREALAYILKGTSSPLAVVTPFSTWAMFLAGLMIANGMVPENTDPSMAYVKAIPFVLYGFIAIILVPLVIFGAVPRIGGLKKAFNRIAETGSTFPLEETKPTVADQPEEATPETGARLFDFLVPIAGLVIIKIFVGVPMELAILTGITICAVLYLPRKIMKPSAFFDSIVEGIQSMVFLLAVMVFAFMLVEANSQLGLTDFVIEVTLPLLSKAWFPAIAFIIAGVLGFATGSFWGIGAILMPIIIPLALELSVNPFLAAGAVISGIVFASHSCFFGDSLLLAAYVTEIKPMNIAIAVIPYAIICAILTIIGYLIIGFAM